MNNRIKNLDISIITPCYNMLPYLKNCIHSVSDQEVTYEHIVIDGNSTDGTKQWLENTSNLKWISENDKGMYDALNKGLKIAGAEIIGHINADEQYLPGTLKYVVDFFDKNPNVDYVVGDFLLVSADGNLRAYRKAFKPYWPFIFSNYLYTFTCAFFYRKRVVEQISYNCSYKSIADSDFVYKVITKGFKGVHLKQYFATYIFTGDNLSYNPISKKELETYKAIHLPKWFPVVKPFLKVGFFIAKVFYGALSHKGSLVYEIYTEDSGSKRKRFIAKKKTWRWN